MAVGVHVVNLRFVGVDGTGNVVDKDDPSVTIKEHLATSHEFRVIPSASVPNSSSSPTIKDFLEAEATDNYVLKHISQTTIITYNQSDLNSA